MMSNADRTLLKKVSEQLKQLLDYWPVLVVMSTIIGIVITATVYVMDYNRNIVKKTEFDAFVKRSNDRYLNDSVGTIKFREDAASHWRLIESKLKIEPLTTIVAASYVP